MPTSALLDRVATWKSIAEGVNNGGDFSAPSLTFLMRDIELEQEDEGADFWLSKLGEGNGAAEGAGKEDGSEGDKPKKEDDENCVVQ